MNDFSLLRIAVSVIKFCLISGQPHRHAKIGQGPHHGCFDFLGVWTPEQRINECPHRLVSETR